MLSLIKRRRVLALRPGFDSVWIAASGRKSFLPVAETTVSGLVVKKTRPYYFAS